MGSPGSRDRYDAPCANPNFPATHMATLAKLWTCDSYDAARLECEDAPRSIGRTCASHSLILGWVLSPSPLFRGPTQQ
jgi:hypothetical protein